jgi:hypothetical protein
MPPEQTLVPVLMPGRYVYEVRRGHDLVAIEDEAFVEDMIRGVRRSPDALNRHEVEARLDPGGFIRTVTVRYNRGPFARNATYEASDDVIRGHLSAGAGRETVSAKLGRMREVDADLLLCKALIIAHVRGRGQARWIGRVATVDPNTLIVASYKQSYRQRDDIGRSWIFEPRMGDAEEIQIDQAGRIVHRRSRDGTETLLTSFAPEPAA